MTIHNKMMIVQAFLGCILLGVMYSNGVMYNEVSGRFRDQMRFELDETVDLAFKSDSFQPASSRDAMSLSATNYNTVGYVYQPIYVSANGAVDTICTSISSVIGYAVNYCLVGKGYTYKFQLTTGNSCAGGVVQFFSDSYCSAYIGSNNLENFANRCAPTKNTTYVGLNAYQQIKCNTGGSPVIPEASVTGETYPNGGCSSRPVEYTSYATDKCMRLFGYVGAVFHCDGVVPQFNTYGDNVCSGGRTSSTSYSTSCSSGTSYGWPLYASDDDYVPPAYTQPTTTTGSVRSTTAFSSVQYCSVRMPTLQPVLSPTAYPTLEGTGLTVSFKVEQILYGISAYRFNFNINNANTVITTIAGSMSRVPSTDVLDLTAEDYSVSVSRRLSSTGSMRGSGAATTVTDGSNGDSIVGGVVGANHAHSVNTLATTLTGVKLFYTVKTTSVYSADQLYTELQRAVSSGAFNQNLYTNAQNSGAESLYGATSDSIQQTHSTKADLSDAELGGIVAGCVVGVIVLLGGCLFYCTSKPTLDVF